MTYRYTDPNGGRLEVTPAIHLIDGQLAVEFFIPLTTPGTGQAGRVRIPVGRIEELVAGIRDARRQAAAHLTVGEGRTRTYTEEQPKPAITTGLVVQPYRTDRGDPAWVFRCWGTTTCDGWLSLDHTSQQSAERARDRHVNEAHQEQHA